MQQKRWNVRLTNHCLVKHIQYGLTIFYEPWRCNCEYGRKPFPLLSLKTT